MKKCVISLVLFLFVGNLSALTIYNVQYTTDPGGDNTYPSNYEGQEVTVTGIVTATDWKGYKDNFYISMPEGGGWRGILIYMAGDTTLALGDEIEVTGTVSEYYGMTEISGHDDPITVTLLSTGNPVPSATSVNCGELMTTTTGEPYEGVVVELSDLTVIQAQDDYGQWYVDDGTGLAQIDDGFFYLDEVEPPIVIEVGQQWETIKGCLDYSYNEYGVNPRTPDDMVALGAVNENPEENVFFIHNTPNPFNYKTEISFFLKHPEIVKIEIFNLLSQKIKTVVNKNFSADKHSVTWNGTDAKGRTVSDGVYFYKLTTPDYSISNKILKID